MFDLNDRVALVTGSSRGIGRAIAESLAAHGARVVISSRNQDACEEVAEAINSSGGQAMAAACNVSDREAVETLCNQVIETWGKVDVLVCNAAANPAFGPMSKLDDSAFDKIFEVNIKSNLWLSNRLAPGMAERGHGSIILISSLAGMMGSKYIGAYAISKAGDAQLARNLAVEWGDKGVRANAIAPGLVKTEFARALWENEKAASFITRLTPLARIGEPEDIAGAALFLASDASRFMTGQTLVVDGGASIHDPFAI